MQRPALGLGFERQEELERLACCGEVTEGTEGLGVARESLGVAGLRCEGLRVERRRGVESTSLDGATTADECSPEHQLEMLPRRDVGIRGAREEIERAAGGVLGLFVESPALGQPCELDDGGCVSCEFPGSNNADNQRLNSSLPNNAISASVSGAL